MEYNLPETRFQSKITVSELNEAGLSALNRFLICVLFYLLKKNGYPVFHSNPISVKKNKNSVSRWPRNVTYMGQTRLLLTSS